MHQIDGSPLDAFTGKVAAPQADTSRKYASYLQRVFVHLKYRQVRRLVIETGNDAGHHSSAPTRGLPLCRLNLRTDSVSNGRELAQH
jgi:hypothetical protein